MFVKYNTTFTLGISVEKFLNQKQSLQRAFARFFGVEAIFVELKVKSEQQRRLLQAQESISIEVTVSYESEAAKNNALEGKTLQFLRGELGDIEVSSNDDAWQTTPTPGPSPGAQEGDTSTPSSPSSDGGGGVPDDGGDIGVIIGIAAGVVVLVVCIPLFIFRKKFASCISLTNDSSVLVGEDGVDPANYYVSIAPIEATTQHDV